MALPCRTTGSLYPSFLPARPVGLTVKHPYAIALNARLPSVLRVPLKASVTFLEATTPVKLPTMHCYPNESGLDSKETKVGISTTAPPRLAPELQSVPTMLHIVCSKSMQSCSEGSRGLSVPWRVTGIFTDTTISPGSWRRQSSTH